MMGDEDTGRDDGSATIDGGARRFGDGGDGGEDGSVDEDGEDGSVDEDAGSGSAMKTGPSAPPPRRPVFLTGMMGSGKSTLAPRLAAAWSAPWLDLDRRIEAIFGETVAALFARSEPHFRRCEAAALRSLLAEPGVSARTLIVATGGGTVVDPSLRAAMASVGIIVHLRVSVDTIVARLVGGGDGSRSQPTRPLLGGDVDALRGRVDALINARALAYASADVVVDGEGDPQDVLCRIVRALQSGEAS